jgi:hypothetical protein
MDAFLSVFAIAGIVLVIVNTIMGGLNWNIFTKITAVISAILMVLVILLQFQTPIITKSTEITNKFDNLVFDKPVKIIMTKTSYTIPISANNIKYEVITKGVE